MFSSSDANLPETTEQSIFDAASCQRVVNDKPFLIILECSNGFRAAELLREERRFSWTNSPLIMLHIVRQDRESMKQAWAIKLRRTSNSTTAIVRMDTSLAETMKAIMNYAVAMELQNVIKILFPSIKDIVDETHPSYYLLTRARSTYVDNVRFARLLVKNEDMLSLSNRLIAEHQAWKELGITHVEPNVL